MKLNDVICNDQVFDAQEQLRKEEALQKIEAALERRELFLKRIRKK